ncbi:MAG: MFS transporter [Thermoleophilia bacterium]
MALGVLRADPVVRRAMVSSLIARLPLVMLPLTVVLLARESGHPYWAVGLVSGAFIASTAVMAPVIGRLADRVGVRPVMLAALTIETAALVVLATVPGRLGLIGLVVVVAVAGAAEPPVHAVIRALLARLVDPAARSGVYTLEASFQEMLFVIGPMLVAVGTGLVDARAVIWAIAGLLVVSIIWFLGVIRGHTAPPRSVGGPSALRSGSLLLLTGVFLALGIMFAAIDIATIATMEEHGLRDWAGIPLGMWAVGSLISGLLFARYVSSDAAIQLPWLLLTMAGSSLVLAMLGHGVVPLTIGLVVQGAAVAPTLGAMYGLVPRASGEERITEAFAWTSAFVLGGVSAGAAGTGVLIDAIGPPSGFVLAATMPLFAAGLAMLLRDRLVGHVAVVAGVDEVPGP